MMEVRWKVDGEISAIEQSFVDYIIRGYYDQDHAQVVAVIQLYVDTVQDYHTSTKEVIIQSDIASGFSSQELIPFMFNMNTIIDDENNVVFSMWIFT